LRSAERDREILDHLIVHHGPKDGVGDTGLRVE
jgi:hypothetical protein